MKIENFLIEVIPAILTDSSDKFKELVKKLEPYANRIHIDVADGEFVPNKTVKGYEELKEMVSAHSMNSGQASSPQVESAVMFDVHLMVKRPQDQMEDWFKTKADRFIIHIEADVEFGEIIKVIKAYNKKIGLALNPETNTDKIEQYLDKINFVQFMTIHPGFQGQSFLNEIVDKISSFHEKYPDIIIMCDGGITPETAPKLARAGAFVLVSGSYIVKSGDVEKAIAQLRVSVN